MEKINISGSPRKQFINDYTSEYFSVYIDKKKAKGFILSTLMIYSWN